MPTTYSALDTDQATAFDDVPASPLNIVILYDDLVAYRRAVRMLADVFCDHASASAVRPLPWRFEELGFRSWRERALANASGADVFVVSTIAKAPIPDEVIEWLRSAFERAKQFSSAVVALCGQAEDARRFSGDCEQKLRSEAEGAGLRFLAPQDLAGAMVR